MLELLRNILRDRGAFFTFIRFCAVGASSAVVYSGSVLLLLDVLRLDYRLAISLAYILGVSAHFVMSRRFTFAAHEQELGGQLGRYLVLLALNYGLTLGVAVASVDFLGLSHHAASALSLFIPMLFTYFVLKRWVFATRAPATTT